MTLHDQCLELARLIREGSKKSTQSRHGLYNRLDKWGDDYETCVLGAILDASGKLDLCLGTIKSEPAYDWLKEQFPVLLESVSFNHGPDNFTRTLSSAMYRLNDSYGKTREEIADWLETLEWNRIEHV